jgi:hypothetical protein
VGAAIGAGLFSVEPAGAFAGGAPFVSARRPPCSSNVTCSPRARAVFAQGSHEATFANELGEPGACETQARSHGRLRKLEDLGDPSSGHLFHVGQNEHDSLRAVEPVEQRVHATRSLVGFE